jgi:hypothetical protein
MSHALLDDRLHTPAEAKDVEVAKWMADLPPQARESVITQMASVARLIREAGVYDPAIHFLKSLEATSRLYNNQSFVDALAQAEGRMKLGAPEDDSADVDELVADLRAGRF